jgi:hypothetical protein
MSEGYQVKIYIVQKSDRNGTLGEILAVKLTFTAAHKIARALAPAKVHCVLADKSDQLNSLPGQE